MPGSSDRNRLPEQHSHDIDLDPRLSQMLATEFPDLIERYEESRALYGVINKLANLRRAQGVTQTQLAELLGRPQSLISAIESGRVSPHIETLVAIARELGHTLTFDIRPLTRANAQPAAGKRNLESLR
ncbi:MAG TPA: helix-turn-helix transcriptional regulator [Dehalococcoidia bacterium]